MKEATALKVIQKESQFLGMGLMETMQFIAQNPLAQPVKTLEAFKVLNPNFEFPKKTVKNLMTGKDVQIEADTPWCRNPASEKYWSM